MTKGGMSNDRLANNVSQGLKSLGSGKGSFHFKGRSRAVSSLRIVLGSSSKASRHERLSSSEAKGRRAGTGVSLKLSEF